MGCDKFTTIKRIDSRSRMRASPEETRWLTFDAELVLIGVVVNVLTAIRQIQFVRGIPTLSVPRPAWFGVVGIALALILTVVGLAMAIYLVAVS
jgi:hypothetical protein